MGPGLIIGTGGWSCSGESFSIFKFSIGADLGRVVYMYHFKFFNIFFFNFSILVIWGEWFISFSISSNADRRVKSWLALNSSQNMSFSLSLDSKNQLPFQSLGPLPPYMFQTQQWAHNPNNVIWVSQLWKKKSNRQNTF